MCIRDRQWSEQYKSLRSSIFKERTEIKKLLSFNMTTIMLKKDLVKMEQSVENEEFNREIEGKQIFDNIRSLKKQQKSLLQLLTKPVLNKEDLLQQVEKYNNQYNEFKDQQINIFEAMISEQSNLQQELEQFDIRLQNSQISASKADSESSDNPKMYTTFKSTAQNLNQVEEQPEDDDEEQDDENQYYKDEFETFEDGEEQQQQQDLQSKGKKSQPISAKQQSSAQQKKKKKKKKYSRVFSFNKLRRRKKKNQERQSSNYKSTKNLHTSTSPPTLSAKSSRILSLQRITA
eukprot:TRINITY_DN9590_c0_g1_i4.p1 TRINITY_DN9590_c0_g1~~TRINITY_DN9590_c0_g1_i4.p1  ORF type:complete len:290 (+),score=67.11 TRINITY_DN9590_c0_g1_i4:155-1024(+)